MRIGFVRRGDPRDAGELARLFAEAGCVHEVDDRVFVLAIGDRLGAAARVVDGLEWLIVDPDVIARTRELEDRFVGVALRSGLRRPRGGGRARPEPSHTQLIRRQR